MAVAVGRACFRFLAPNSSDLKRNPMAMEMRQQLKLSQQLVMTPQLQQAIKLLQLSRMELVELVREEMLENPCLDDDMEVGADMKDPKVDLGSDDDFARGVEHAGATELPALEHSGKTEEVQSEVKADSSAVNEIDWQNYLDDYSSAAPMPGGRPDSADLP